MSDFVQSALKGIVWHMGKYAEQFYLGGIDYFHIYLFHVKLNSVAA